MSAPRDEISPQQIVAHDVVYRGLIWDLARDEVALPHERVMREYVVHPGAVGVLALDADDKVLLIRQYRHPVRSYLWEIPAGLLDVEGEHPLRTAQRELFEETDHVAARWHTLYDTYNSPGGSNEAVRCYLARDVTPARGRAFAREGEERDMPTRWVSLDELVAGVLRGEIHNPTTSLGVLTAQAFRAAGWSGLRPPDAPWPERFPGGMPPLVPTSGASLDSAATQPGE